MLKDVASQDEAHFTAVRPIGPHLVGFEAGFANHMAKFRGRRGKPRGPNP
jgi:hypothetical protein